MTTSFVTKSDFCAELKTEFERQIAQRVSPWLDIAYVIRARPALTDEWAQCKYAMCGYACDTFTTRGRGADRVIAFILKRTKEPSPTSNCKRIHITTVRTTIYSARAGTYGRYASLTARRCETALWRMTLNLTRSKNTHAGNDCFQNANAVDSPGQVDMGVAEVLEWHQR